jgi:hypothetical protein
LFTPRYHAISLVAVFLSLGIGVLLGVALGEEGIVSNASKDLEKSLRGDLGRARSKNADLRKEVEQREEYARQAYPGLVAGQLPGSRVGILALGSLPSGYTSAVRDAVEPAGATVESVSVLEEPLPRGRLASELKGTKLARVDRSDDALERLGRRAGRQLALGGDLLPRLRQDLFSTSRGKYRGLDAVVVVRDRDDSLKGDKKRAQDRFEAAMLDALQGTDVRVVGVEKTGTDPSQVGFMKDRDITSVDDLELVAGRTALVWAVAGADGHFGSKGSADRLLPPPPEEGAVR